MVHYPIPKEETYIKICNSIKKMSKLEGKFKWAAEVKEALLKRKLELEQEGI